ncbi:hypothetical protein GCM10010350_81660 [Streptomyces galilaeus]|nr:hypothetical protein GCM10010350_81660 [Streptomyces galilaeus]
MVNCEQTRAELAVQALTGDRHGGMGSESAAHLGSCAECSAERQRLAEVTLALSMVGLLAFEGLRPADARTAPRRTPESRETAFHAWGCACPRT